MRAAVRLEKPDHGIRAARVAPVQLLECRVRLTYAWSNTEVDAMATARPRPRLAADTIKHLLGAGPAILAWHESGC